MDFNLPEQARVHKVVPKSKFFARAVVKSKLKSEFAELVQKIIWEYKLSPATIGIPATHVVEEVQIFSIELKERTIPKNVLKVIDKSIPYPILFVLTHNTHTAYGISLKSAGDDRYYFSKWDKLPSLRFSGTTLETLLQGLIKAFIDESSSNTNDFATIIERDRKRQALEREISTLQTKLRNEKQFNYKVDINVQLQAKKQELTLLIKETL